MQKLGLQGKDFNLYIKADSSWHVSSTRQSLGPACRFLYPPSVPRPAWDVAVTQTYVLTEWMTEFYFKSA
jgi:hypothetical protein